METEYWIIVGEQPTGPYTRAQLQTTPGFTPDTMVWYESLTDWIPASQVAALSDLCQAAEPVSGMPQVPDGDAVPGMPPIAEPEAEPTFSYGTPAGAYTAAAYTADIPDADTMPARPANHLGWAIASILLFFPTGIIALIYAIKVNTHYRNLDLVRAGRCSERVQWWIMISIVLALVTGPIRILIGF